MLITVKLFATFRDGRFKIETRKYTEGARVSDVLASLDIAESEVGTLFIRSRHVEPDRELADGDTLAIFPLVGGG